MPVTIGSNIASIRSQRYLNRATDALSSTYEKLSSGQRINKASDDAAGLAIADDLNTRTKVYTQAVRNANDGQSLLTIADSAIGELNNIVIRIRELAQQSANGTFKNTQRKSLDTEAQALANEFARISRVTEFNGTKLFDGSLASGLRLQLGYGIDGSLSSTLGGAIGTGTYSTTTTYALAGATYASDAKLGDVNGDGILDLVSAISGGGFSISFGAGDGTFSSTTSIALAGTTPFGVALGDVNNDGILDIAIAGSTSAGFTNILLGNGNGTFQSPITYATESITSHDVTFGDLNGDGNLDLLTSGNEAGVGYATVRLGNGNWTFQATTSYAQETSASLCYNLGRSE